MNDDTKARLVLVSAIRAFAFLRATYPTLGPGGKAVLADMERAFRCANETSEHDSSPCGEDNVSVGDVE